MIRVNVLEAPRPKARRPSPLVPVIERGDARSPKLKVLSVLIMTAAVNLAYWRHLEREKTTVNRQLEALAPRSRAVAQVKPAYLEKQKQSESCKRRLAVIERLRAQRRGPADLLMAIADTINRTDFVWLNHFRDSDNAVEIEGMSLGPDGVANLMTSLAQSGYFQKVELKESIQDETAKESRAYLFTLMCERSKN